jgi:hypothetical protein
LKTGDGRDGIATDHKMSSVVSLNGELKWRYNSVGGN